MEAKELKFTQFVRKPFTVDAVRVTTENIEDVAEFVGDLRHKDDGTPYIQVNRRLVPNVFRVYPGFWMTLLDGNVRCYSGKAFHAQFAASTPSIMEWVEFMSKLPDNGNKPTAA